MYIPIFKKVTMQGKAKDTYNCFRVSFSYT